ncbi:MAG: hypothetical protein HYR71_00210 [Chloroflexi bacterium]|nr:hypothetical protein [Chloroflexota bacterium]
MIIWGGSTIGNVLNSGARYNPLTDSWTPTGTGANVPAARSGHTAVWTGSEMMVWGGSSGSANLNSGARYNPATNSWTAMSTTSAPTARSGHRAVWTGDQMIVWGGYNGTSGLNTGGRYTPATNSWRATSTIGAPAGRWAHVGVWSGTEVIVWGGYNGTTALNTGGRYNPATNAWTATTATGAPTARWDFAGVWTGSELVLWGGIVNNSWPYAVTDTGGRYNPASNSWASTSTLSAPSPRRTHTAVWTGSQMIVWGGWLEPSTQATNAGGLYCAAVNVTLASLTVNPTTVTGGSPSTGTVALSGPAPAGGALVGLSSSNSAVASVPASVTVPEGATAANFTITTFPVSANKSVTISGTYNGATVSAMLKVKPPALSSLTLNPNVVVGGAPSTGTVRLTGPAPSGGTLVTLSSSNPAVATVPASVTVPAGTTSANFTVNTSPVAMSTTVTTSGSLSGVSKSAILTVTP